MEDRVSTTTLGDYQAALAAIFRMAATAVAGGLTAPQSLNVYSDNRHISMSFNQRDAVDEWADYLAMPKPEQGGSYRSWVSDCAALPGWAMYIWCPLPEEATP
jgi:hypothetical protein